RLPLPMTAPVKAIFATFTADVVGLRCRPLIGALGPLLRAHEVSCRVRAGEVARPCWARLHPKGPQAAPGPFMFGGPVGPPPPSRFFVVVPYTNGWSSARLGTAGQTITGRWLGTE